MDKWICPDQWHISNPNGENGYCPTCETEECRMSPCGCRKECFHKKYPNTVKQRECRDLPLNYSDYSVAKGEYYEESADTVDYPEWAKQQMEEGP